MRYIDIVLRASSSGASPPEEGKVLLLNVHEGIYGHHTSSRSMVKKAFREEFYWPTTTSDAMLIVRSCRGCQYFTR
jgi:hypothetical protein